MSLGIGTVFDATSRGRYMERQMMSQRAHPVRVHRAGEAVQDAGDLAWEPYDCLYLCVPCGYLADAADVPCPGCGNPNWTDLRYEPNAENIRYMESQRRRVYPRPIQIAAAVTAGVTAYAVGFTWTAVEMEGGAQAAALAPQTIASLIVLSPVLFFTLRRLLTWIRYRRRPLFSGRWRLPVPLPHRRARVEWEREGDLQPSEGEALIRAPLSGAPCLGYEVTVLFDETGDRRPPMWVLEEERTVACTMDGERLEADRLTLALPAAPVRLDQAGEGETKLKRFLRRRGLFLADGDYQVFEARVEPGTRYRVTRYDRPAGSAAVLGPVQE